MGVGDQAREQRFPFSAEVVFAQLQSVLPQLGFKVREVDTLLCRITASTGVSLMSWGENLALAVNAQEENTCVLRIDSGVKIGMNFTGSHRNSKNIDTVIGGLSRALQSRG